MNPDLAWALWWHRPWLAADPAWLPAPLQGLDAAPLEALGRGQHAAVAGLLGIGASNPAQPNPVSMFLFGGDRHALPLTCALVAATCNPRDGASTLSDDNRAWCQRTAKALRPGQWLTPDEDALALLWSWLDGPTWARARLRFPPARVLALEAQRRPAPPWGKLDALWQSAGWRAERSLDPARARPSTPYQEPADADAAYP